MFYWIYDIPSIAAVMLFAAIFVGTCWLGIIVTRPWLERLPAFSRG